VTSARQGLPTDDDGRRAAIGHDAVRSRFGIRGQAEHRVIL
jgi:hypothetical protein